jgi:hypothetical protein
MITAPTQISNCAVWLDASDTTTLFQLSGGTTAVAANLDPVGYWGDKSGNNRHFLNNAGTTTSRPTWISSLSTVRFDGSNDYLSSYFNLTYTAQSVFVVTSTRVYVNSSRVYSQVSTGADDTASGHYIPCMKPVGISTAIGSYYNGALRSNATQRGLSSFDIFTSWVSSTSGINFINGTNGGYYGASMNYSVTLSRLGAPANTASIPGSYYTGDISEVIVYNRALTNNERADVEYYLTRKWNFLYSIPRQAYAIKNGLWSDSTTWSISAEPSPWNFPLSADNAYTNTFTVTADSSTRGGTLQNSTLAPNILSGGSFVLANEVSLSANVLGGVAPYTLTLNPAANATLVGNISGGSVATSHGLGFFADSTISVLGNIIGGTTTSVFGVNLSSTNTVTVNLIGDSRGSTGTSSHGINTSAGTLNVNLTGNVLAGTGTTAYGINNASTGTININGISSSIVSNTSNPSINNASTGTINLTAASIVANNSQYVYIAPNTLGVNKIYASIINAPNGRQAIYAPRYQVFPSASATYTRQAVNGYDSYIDYWTSDATLTYPASSDVALNTVYSNNTLSGSMALPPTSAVVFGASVGTTTGTASITINSILSQPLSGLTTSSSIGARLKNITTTQALSSIANSLNFTN